MERGQHIIHRYDQELEDLRNQVLQMAGLVETQVENSIKALLERDKELANQVVKQDRKVNQLELDIDEVSTVLIARRQPTASDLRLIVGAIKIVTDLERIGDEAEAIASYAHKLSKKKRGVASIHSELEHMCRLVVKILHDAIDTFARMDVDKAIDIINSNESVNREFDSLFRLLLTFMAEDHRNLKNVLRVTWCARSLERISDHSRNICEYVIYLVKGTDIRHINPDDWPDLGSNTEEE